MVGVKIVLEKGAAVPQYQTKGAAGMDLKAFIPYPMELEASQCLAIPTGIKIRLPEGFEAQVRPRSGLALNYSVTVLNTPGTVDSDYRGEVKVILINHSNKPYVIQPGERIAQMVINKVERCEFEVVDVLESTERKDGGFGSTGKI